jgi:hypothetical protein
VSTASESKNVLAATMEMTTESRKLVSMDAETFDLDPVEETALEKTAESKAEILESEVTELKLAANGLRLSATEMLEEAYKLKSAADKLEKEAAKNQKIASKLQLYSFVKKQEVDGYRFKVDEDAQFVLPDEGVNPVLREYARHTLKEAEKYKHEKYYILKDVPA